MPNLNLKLKDNIDASILQNYGLKPKYDVDTGNIVEYCCRFEVGNGKEKHFSFIYCTTTQKHWFRRMSYQAWMTGFDWEDITSNECMKLLFRLIKDDIVEIVEESKE